MLAGKWKLHSLCNLSRRCVKAWSCCILVGSSWRNHSNKLSFACFENHCRKYNLNNASNLVFFLFSKFAQTGKLIRRYKAIKMIQETPENVICSLVYKASLNRIYMHIIKVPKLPKHAWCMFHPHKPDSALVSCAIAVQSVSQFSGEKLPSVFLDISLSHALKRKVQW